MANTEDMQVAITQAATVAVRAIREAESSEVSQYGLRRLSFQ